MDSNTLPEGIHPDGDRRSFEQRGQVTVMIGPCSGTAFKEKKIPLDGRHYIAGGVVILKNGKRLRAELRIQTHEFQFLERDGTYVETERGWFLCDDPDLLLVLGVTHADAFPFTWLPDVPLDYHEPGPYPSDWYEAKLIAEGVDEATRTMLLKAGK
jgi:hypothetical protein